MFSFKMYKNNFEDPKNRSDERPQSALNLKLLLYQPEYVLSIITIT